MPVDLRPVYPEEFMMRPSPKPEFWYWAKSSTGLPDDPIAHYGALSFISDWWFSASGNMSHVDQVISTSYFVTSLNHTVWFHRRLRADDWLLFCSQSPSAHGARSLCLGKVWDRQGRRVASLAQEVLGRQRS
jgi:acyl-CoA thioesterase-2